MNNQIKEILEALKPQDEEFTKAGIKEYPLYLRPDQQRILLDYITNLEDYKSRIDKAVEYMDNNPVGSYIELKYILNGDDLYER